MSVAVPTMDEFNALVARVAALEGQGGQGGQGGGGGGYAAILPPATGGDDTAAVNAVLQRVAAGGGTVYAPGGNVWCHDGMIEVPGGVTLLGDGEGSEFRSTHQTDDGWPQHAIHLTGTRPGLRSVKLTTAWRGERQGTPTSQAVWVDRAIEFAVDDVHVFGSAAGGVFCERSSYGTVLRCLIENTLADGIGIGYSGSSHNTATDNTIRNAGDDAISVVSYTDDPQSTGNQILNNIVLGGTARGIVDVGGKETVIRNNNVEGTNACGILTIQDAHWNTYASVGATVEGNTVSACARAGSGYSANYQFDVGTEACVAVNNVSENPHQGHYGVHPTATVTSSGNVPAFP